MFAHVALMWSEAVGIYCSSCYFICPPPSPLIPLHSTPPSPPLHHYHSHTLENIQRERERERKRERETHTHTEEKKRERERGTHMRQREKENERREEVNRVIAITCYPGAEDSGNFVYLLIPDTLTHTF